MDNRPIGVFDSGLGGLTAVREFLSVLPCEDIVYFGDTGRVPYGSRSKDILQTYARQDIDFLKTQNVKMIVAACGTVSSTAGNVGENCGIPYTGVLKPTVDAALKASKNGKIGVIATRATIASGIYEKMLLEANPDLFIQSTPCPLFVPFVEEGIVDPNDPMVQLVVERYLSKLRDSGIDTLILGCTHYPVLKRAIGNYMGDKVALINSGKETALYCAKLLKEMDMLSDSQKPGTQNYYVSDRVEEFYPVAKLCLQKELDANVHFVDIAKF